MTPKLDLPGNFSLEVAIFAPQKNAPMFFKASKEGGTEWWMYLLGVVTVAMGYLLGQLPLGLVVMMKSMEAGSGSLEAFSESMDFGSIGLDPNVGFLLALLMFVGAFLALWLAIRLIHKRTLASLVNGYGKVRWSRFLFGLGIWTLFGVVIECVNYGFDPSVYHFQFELRPFLVLTLIALCLIPLQTSFEELFIRGYLMQGLGRLTGSRIGAALLSSGLFMALHLMNPEIGKFGLGVMIPYYFIVAFFLAAITLLDDGLELAMGIHAATNLFGSLFVTFEGSALQTPALFRLDAPHAGLMLAETIIAMAVFSYLAARKYRWASLRRLLGPIDLPEEMDVVTFKRHDTEP